MHSVNHYYHVITCIFNKSNFFQCFSGRAKELRRFELGSYAKRCPFVFSSMITHSRQASPLSFGLVRLLVLRLGSSLTHDQLD